MTNEEAIDVLQKEKPLRILGYEEIHDAYDVAIEALEKQIPQKLRFTTSTKRCSSCGKQITSIGAIHNEYRYCKYCGQAIDWSGE